MAIQIASGILIPWEDKIPINSPLRFWWSPVGITSIFVFFNLLLLSVIFGYVKRTGVSTDPISVELRAGGLGTVVSGFLTMVIAIIVAALVALVSWLVFGSPSAVTLIPTGMAAWGWLLILLGIAQVITGRDLLAEDEKAQAARDR